ncbi:MAG: ArsR family transcriptional regulator [Ferruginibacter sp.]
MNKKSSCEVSCNAIFVLNGNCKVNRYQFHRKSKIGSSESISNEHLKKNLEKGAVRCCDVVSITGLSQPTCSHHIKLLADSELIECKKEGRNNFFSINKDNFKLLEQYFQQFSKV